jgi:hypothetical protein
VAADTILRLAAVDITPAAGAPLAEAVDTPQAVDIREVAAAVTPVAEDMAAAIAKKLGDGMSLREAAT